MADTNSFIFQTKSEIVAGEFIAGGEMVYIGSDGLAYNADPNAPKSEKEAQERRMERRLFLIQQLIENPVIGIATKPLEDNS